MRLDWGLIADVLGGLQEKLRCHIVVDNISSTNDWNKWSCGKSQIPAVCLAEQQSSGRGRKDRNWLSPSSENIYLSLVWPFTTDQQSAINGLSLVAGVAIAQVLTTIGIDHVKVKWPNDVLVADKKIAGILIESRIAHNKEIVAVIGVGVNYLLSDITRLAIGQPCTDICSECGNAVVPDRNQVAGLVISELIKACELFQQHGFTAFVDDWNRYDACQNQEIFVHDETGVWAARVVGLNDDCSLRVVMDDVSHNIYAADVSIRIR